MIDYLNQLLVGQPDGVEINVIFSGERHAQEQTLLAVDAVGIVLARKQHQTFWPWHMISRIDTNS